MAKAGAGWLGGHVAHAAHRSAEMAKAGAGYVAQKGKQAWGGAKAAGQLAAGKGSEALAWVMHNRPLLVGGCGELGGRRLGRSP